MSAPVTSHRPASRDRFTFVRWCVIKWSTSHHSQLSPAAQPAIYGYALRLPVISPPGRRVDQHASQCVDFWDSPEGFGYRLDWKKKICTGLERSLPCHARSLGCFFLLDQLGIRRLFLISMMGERRPVTRQCPDEVRFLEANRLTLEFFLHLWGRSFGKKAGGWMDGW